MRLSDSKSHISQATPEAMVLAGCVVSLIAVTGMTPLDSAVRTMLAPLGPMLFSATLPLWTFIITTALLTVGLLALMSGCTHRARGARTECWRENGVFLILLVLIGPALSDSLQLVPGSAGFYAAAGWWIGKRHHPGWAWASLASGLILGLALGFEAMAAGTVRLSEVLWSGLAILGLAHALYYYVLRLPRSSKPTAEPSTLSNHLDVSARLPGLPAMCLLLVIAAVARLPHDPRLPRLHWVAHLDAPASVHIRLR